MTASPRSAETADARVVAVESARTYQDALTERLAACYLLGSLAYGGYAPAVSDIDLAVVLSEVRDGDRGIIEATTATLRARGGAYRKLSLFWSSLPALREGHADGRFPALDRLQLAERGELLRGADVAGQVVRPATGELLCEGARFALDVLATDQVIAEFRRPDRLLSDPVWFTKAVLFPVRFLCTAATMSGRAATNDEAVAWYLAQQDPVAPSLVRLATRVRAGSPLDAGEVAAQLPDLIPLYQHYIENQTRLLRAAGAPNDLIVAFPEWSGRLANA